MQKSQWSQWECCTLNGCRIASAGVGSPHVLFKKEKVLVSLKNLGGFTVMGSKAWPVEAVNVDWSAYSNTHAYVCTSIQPSESIGCMFGAGVSYITVIFINSHIIQIKIWKLYWTWKISLKNNTHINLQWYFYLAECNEFCRDVTSWKSG